jgi:pimeloyl-ACP methyl ester carboxylesterase
MRETLVLLPDMLCDARGWADVTTALNRVRPVMVAPVWTGERIEEMASATLSGAPAKFALAGHGLGGVIALEMVRRAPERVNRIALIGTNALGDTPQEAADREPLMIGARAGRFEEMLAQEVLPVQVAAGPGRGAHLARLSQIAQELGAEVFVRQQHAMQRRRDHQGSLRRITRRALVLAGALDRIAPLKRQEFVADLIPHATLKVLDGVGHSVMLEDPESTIAALETWLDPPPAPR